MRAHTTGFLIAKLHNYLLSPYQTVRQGPPARTDRRRSRHLAPPHPKSGSRGNLASIPGEFPPKRTTQSPIPLNFTASHSYRETKQRQDARWTGRVSRGSTAAFQSCPTCPPGQRASDKLEGLWWGVGGFEAVCVWLLGWGGGGRMVLDCLYRLRLVHLPQEADPGTALGAGTAPFVSWGMISTLDCFYT